MLCKHQYAVHYAGSQHRLQRLDVESSSMESIMLFTQGSECSFGLPISRTRCQSAVLPEWHLSALWAGRLGNGRDASRCSCKRLDCVP